MNSVFQIFLFLIIFSSCAPVYIPNSVNVPLFKSKGQTSISGSFGAAGIELQGAHSISKNVFLTGAGNYHGLLDNKSIVYFGEAGAGYFKKIGKNGLFEISGGGGMGKVNSTYFNFNNSWWLCFDCTTITSKGNYFRTFLQSVLAYTHENFDLGLSFRNSYVYFPLYQEEISSYRDKIIVYNQECFFAEPVIFLRMGGERVKLSGQMGLSLPYYYLNYYPTYNVFFISAGINLKLGRLEEKIK